MSTDVYKKALEEILHDCDKKNYHCVISLHLKGGEKLNLLAQKEGDILIAQDIPYLHFDYGNEYYVELEEVQFLSCEYFPNEE